MTPPCCSKCYRAGPDDAGERLDVFLAHCVKECSRSVLARLCEEGRVWRGGDRVGKGYRVSAGDVFRVEIPAPLPAAAIAQDIPLDVVYEDGALLVVDKPRGLVVHPAAGHADGTLVNALLHHCAGELSGIGGVSRPGIVHRLDRDTSGLLVVAKHDAAHRHLAAQLAGRQMSRVYEAVAWGVMRHDSGTVDRPIGRDPKNRKRMAALDAGGKPAVTRYIVLERFPKATHIECRLETGRTHQIRAHMRSLGHPLLGDRLYGAPDNWGLHGQCLHAKELAFTHPESGKAMRFTAIKPTYFTAVLEALRHS